MTRSEIKIHMQHYNIIPTNSEDMNVRGSIFENKKKLSRVIFTYKSTSIIHFLTGTLKIVCVNVDCVQIYKTKKTVFHFEIEISEYCSSLDFLLKILDNNIILGRKRPM